MPVLGCLLLPFAVQYPFFFVLLALFVFNKVWCYVVFVVFAYSSGVTREDAADRTNVGLSAQGRTGFVLNRWHMPVGLEWTGGRVHRQCKSLGIVELRLLGIDTAGWILNVKSLGIVELRLLKSVALVVVRPPGGKQLPRSCNILLCSSW